jgi:hypothetical protein
MIDVGAEVLDDPLHHASEPRDDGTASLDQGRPFGGARSGPHCDDRPGPTDTERIPRDSTGRRRRRARAVYSALKAIFFVEQLDSRAGRAT